MTIITRAHSVAFETPPPSLTGTFTATGAGPSTAVFGIFLASGWGTPLNSDGTSGSFVGTIRLERSVGGGPWLPVSTDGTGAPAVYSGAFAVEGAEAASNAAYRFNCINYTSGTINYSLVGPGWLVG